MRERTLIQSVMPIGKSYEELVRNRSEWTSDELEDPVRQLDIALKVSGVGIWRHNLKRRQTRSDKQLQAIYGVEPGEYDASWLELVNPHASVGSKRMLISSLVDIARTLGMQVVAEGVEADAHGDLIEALGVDALQGFAFGRPQPASRTETHPAILVLHEGVQLS